MKQPYLEAGKIINTFGIRGEVKLQPWCDSAEFLLEDVNAAMALKNKIVYFARSDAKLPRGSFFLADLIGADVLDEDGRNIGKLTEVLDMPAGRVYMVQGEEEHSIPAVPEFILETNVEEHYLRVHLIEGM